MKNYINNDLSNIGGAKDKKVITNIPSVKIFRYCSVDKDKNNLSEVDLYIYANEKNKLIDLPEDFDESLIFHSGTKSRGSNLYTNGGRVMCVTSLSESLNQALEKSLKVCSKINFDGKYYRKDIGRDLINY